MLEKISGYAMDTVHAIRNRILQLFEERNITIKANISGLVPSSVKNNLYGKRKNPKIETIKMICDGLELTLAQFSVLRSLGAWSKALNSGSNIIL